jgi:hypothetical protein
VSSMSVPETRKRHGLWMGILCLGTTLGGPVLAGPAPPPRPPSGEVRDPEDVRETIQVLMIVSMKKALELTQEQALQVIPRVQEVFDERGRFAQARREALRTMQSKLSAESVPERDVREAVSRLDRLETEHRNLEQRLREEIDRTLNPRQQAQLRLFVPRFRRQMMMHIEEARRMSAERSRERAIPAWPEDDFDSPDDEF